MEGAPKSEPYKNETGVAPEEKPATEPSRAERHFEVNEGNEAFRATLGFDLIFVRGEDGEKQCYCIEINGEKTGVLGMEDIPEGQIDPMLKYMAKIRAEMNPKRIRKADLAEEIDAELNASTLGTLKIHEFMKKSVEKEKLFEKSEKNPPFIEKLSRDKRLQQQYIPEGHKPREYAPGESPLSSTGYWICKAVHGQGGRDVYVLTNGEFARFLEAHTEDQNYYIAQEFLHAEGAELAPEEFAENRASMRFLIDFRYMEDGTMEPMFQTGYQRVAASSTRLPIDFQSRDERQEHAVVNKTTGALSFAASKEELDAAKVLAAYIIHNIAAAYKADTNASLNKNVSTL